MLRKVLYKYRSLDSLEFILDILLNERLHAAPYHTLNDPMEGVFTYSPDPALRNFIKELVIEKRKLNICALSETPNNTLMWAYYGGSHQGVAIGVKLNEHRAGQVDVAKVNYTNSLKFEPFYGSQPSAEAKGVLLKKLAPWKHEKEVRVFTREPFVPVSIKTVHLGHEMPERREELVRDLVGRLCPMAVVTKLDRGDLDSQSFLANVERPNPSLQRTAPGSR